MHHAPLGARGPFRAPEQLPLDIFAPGVPVAPTVPAVGIAAAAPQRRRTTATLRTTVAVFSPPDARVRLAAYEACAEPTASIATLLDNAAVAGALGLGGDMPSEGVMAAFVQLFDERGFPAEEIAALRPGSPEAIVDAIVARLASASGFTRRPPTRVAGGDADCDPDDVRAFLDPGVRLLDETCVEEEAPELLPSIDVATLTRCRAMRSPVVGRAALLECVLFRRAEPGSPIGAVVAAWEGFDELVEISGVDLMDARALGRLMGRYARREILPEHTDGLRRRVLGRIRAAWNNALSYIAEHVGFTDAVMAAVLPLPELSSLDRDAVAKFRAEHTRDCKSNRKKAARGVTRRLDAVLAAGIARVAEARAFADAVREAEALMRTDALTGVMDFGYDDVVVEDNGSSGGARTVLMRAHWLREYEAARDAGGAFQHRLGFEDGGEGAVPFDPAVEPVVIQYLSVEARDDGTSWWDHHDAAAVPPPRTIAHHIDGVMLPPSGMPPELLQRRHDRLAAEGLPFPRGRPAGLMGPDGAAQARLFSRALADGIVLVAPDPCLHGMLLALAVALMITSSFARGSEVRQVVQDVLGWTVVGQGRFAADAFYSRPKGRSDRAIFRVSPMAYDSLTAVLEFWLLREGLAEVPLSQPSRDLSRKCSEARHVFAIRGRMLSIDDLNHLLAFLFGGVARVRTHDLRHAAAVRARKEGATLGDIASWMNVAGGCVRDYAFDDEDEDDDPDCGGGLYRGVGPAPGPPEDPYGAAGLEIDEVAESALRQFDWFEARADVQAILGGVASPVGERA